MKRIKILSKRFLKMKKTKQAVTQEVMERELFLKKANEEYAQLLQDSSFVQQEQEDRTVWDVTLVDGLL